MVDEALRPDAVPTPVGRTRPTFMVSPRLFRLLVVSRSSTKTLLIALDVVDVVIMVDVANAVIVERSEDLVGG